MPAKNNQQSKQELYMSASEHLSTAEITSLNFSDNSDTEVESAGVAGACGCCGPSIELFGQKI